MCVKLGTPGINKVTDFCIYELSNVFTTIHTDNVT